VTGVLEPPPPFAVYTVAEALHPVTARNGLSVNPRHALEDCPAPDILLIPGGLGTRREMHNRALTDWIARRAEKAELVLSVCTGALLLAKAGLLDGLEGHHPSRRYRPAAGNRAPDPDQPGKTVYRQRQGDRFGRNLGRDRHVALCSGPLAGRK